MAAIQWQDVSDAATELVKLAPAAQLRILKVVNGGGLSVSNFDGEAGDLTRTARVLLAAHMATLFLRRGNGALASQSEGGAAQSYWYGFQNPRLLHTTGYGQELALMISGTAARAGLIV